MSGILNSGKLATLLDRLSSARAGYLDNLTKLDATVSTLLTNGGYTAARAAKLDNLDAAVSGASGAVPVSMSGLVVSSAVGGINTYFSSTSRPNLPASGNTSCGGTQNVYTNLWSVSGNGYITGLSLFAAEALSANYQFKLTIDGSTIVESASNFWASAASNTGLILVGGDRGTPTEVKFTTSFAVAVRCTSTNAAKNFNSHCGYYTIA